MFTHSFSRRLLRFQNPEPPGVVIALLDLISIKQGMVGMDFQSSNLVISVNYGNVHSFYRFQNLRTTSKNTQFTVHAHSRDSRSHKQSITIGHDWPFSEEFNDTETSIREPSETVPAARIDRRLLPQRSATFADRRPQRPGTRSEPAHSGFSARRAQVPLPERLEASAGGNRGPDFSFGMSLA